MSKVGKVAYWKGWSLLSPLAGIALVVFDQRLIFRAVFGGIVALYVFLLWLEAKIEERS